MGTKENQILVEYGSALGFGQQNAKRGANPKKRRGKREVVMAGHAG